MLRPCDIRWLSEIVSIKRILGQWLPLKFYFAEFNKIKEKSSQTTFIFNILTSNIAKKYFHFLDRTLEKISFWNLMLQSERSKILLMYKSAKEIYVTMLR